MILVIATHGRGAINDAAPASLTLTVLADAEGRELGCCLMKASCRIGTGGLSPADDGDHARGFVRIGLARSRDQLLGCLSAGGMSHDKAAQLGYESTGRLLLLVRDAEG